LANGNSDVCPATYTLLVVSDSQIRSTAAPHAAELMTILWSTEVFGKVVYESDQILTACMFLRIYLAFRVFRDFYGLNREDNRYIG